MWKSYSTRIVKSAWSFHLSLANIAVNPPPKKKKKMLWVNFFAYILFTWFMGLENSYLFLFSYTQVECFAYILFTWFMWLENSYLFLFSYTQVSIIKLSLLENSLLSLFFFFQQGYYKCCEGFRLDIRLLLPLNPVSNLLILWTRANLLLISLDSVDVMLWF